MSHIERSTKPTTAESPTPPIPRQTDETVIPQRVDSATPTTLESPAAPSDSGRDARGRFTKNNPGGPGNPFARRTAAARKAFCEAVSQEDLVQIAQTIKQRAKEGDMAAAKLLLSYVIGKPEAAVAPDTLDIDEFKLYEEEGRHYSKLAAVAATPGLDLACTIARTSRPGIAEVAARDLSHALIEGEFPEGSPFAPPEFECQEAQGSDTGPSPVGSIGGAETADGGTPTLPEAGAEPSVLEALGLSRPETAGSGKVDAEVVSMAVALLYEDMMQANGGQDETGKGPEQPTRPTAVARKAETSSGAGEAGRPPAPLPNGGIRGCTEATRSRKPPTGERAGE